MDGTCGSKHLIRPCPYADILGEILPTHRARTVDEKLRRARYVMPIRPSPRMQKRIPADHLSLGIAKKGERETCFVPQFVGDVRRVHADCHRPDPLGLKVGKSLLNAPQLEDAEWSPISAIKDQQHRLRRGISA